MKRLAVLWTIFLLAGAAGAQEGPLIWNHLGVRQGLSQASNWYVYKDRRGFVWISSVNGLNRFDGQRVEVFLPDPEKPDGLAGENVQSTFFEDSAGNIWFTTFDAVNVYDWRCGSFRNHVLADSAGTPVKGYRAIHLEDSRLWVLAGDQQLFALNLGTGIFDSLTPVPTGTQFAHRVRGSPTDGVLLCYRMDAPGVQCIGYHQKKRTNVCSLTDENGNALGEPRSVISDRTNRVWIATRNALYAFASVPGTPVGKFPCNAYDLVDYSDSTLLVAIADSGIWEMHKRSGHRFNPQWPDPTQPHRLHHGNIQSMSMDSDGTLWANADGYLLSYGHPRKRKFDLVMPTAPQGLPNPDFSPNGMVEAADGTVWVTTSSGGVYLFHPDGRLATDHPRFDEMRRFIPRACIGIQVDLAGSIWVMTWKGLFRAGPGLSPPEQVTPEGFVVLSAACFADGRLACSRRGGGVYLFSRSPAGGWTHRPISALPAGSEYLPLFLDARGRLWCNEETRRWFVVDTATLMILDTLYAQGLVNGIYQANERSLIWVASHSGLRGFDPETLEPAPVKWVGRGASAMVADAAGKLWVAAGNELASFDPHSGNCRVYGLADGLPSYEFMDGAAARLHDGSLWLGTRNAIVRFHPNNIRDLDVQAKPQLASLLINDRPATLPQACISLENLESLNLSYRENTISMSLGSLEYSHPPSTGVRYRLIGIDDAWLEAQAGSLLRYPALQPGTYRLEWMARNSDGVLGAQWRAIDFHIRPPFWKTLWFMALTFITAVLIVASFVYLALSRKFALQTVRLRLYENLHDDLGARLTAIAIAAQEMCQRGQATAEKLDQLAGTAKGIVANMRRLIWAMDPECDRFSSFTEKLRADATQLLPESLRFELSAPECRDELALTGEIRYQLNAVFNEALANAAKYAGASNIRVQFFCRRRQLEMVIEDDGSGFKSADPRHAPSGDQGYGLRNMERRISRIKGHIRIDAHSGKGTRIEVFVPLSRRFRFGGFLQRSNL
ncbi:MAG: hypothetical protein IT266_01935 [Saprospiraceae bacterium]|nr:hypothetical protein [Saprospiraceae bacterium]